MERGTYVGPIEHLRNHKALIRPSSKPGLILVQFDSCDLSIQGRCPNSLDANLGYGWHEFLDKNFKRNNDEYLDCPQTT